MSNQFGQHIGMQGEDDETGAREKAAKIYGDARETLSATASQARRHAGQAVGTVRENPGTISTVAILFGIAGFAIGWACGQSSARSERYWR